MPSAGKEDNPRTVFLLVKPILAYAKAQKNAPVVAGCRRSVSGRGSRLDAVFSHPLLRGPRLKVSLIDWRFVFLAFKHNKPKILLRLSVQILTTERRKMH